MFFILSAIRKKCQYPKVGFAREFRSGRINLAGIIFVFRNIGLSLVGKLYDTDTLF